MGTGLYDVMDRTNMGEILKEQGFQTSGSCTDLGCIIKVGQILGVEKMFGGTIGQLGTKYVISVKMIDVKTSRLEKMEMENYVGPIENMEIPVKNLVLKLMGKTLMPSPVNEYSIPDMNALAKYDREKKDYTKALFYTIIPGGGHFYAENYYLGSFFLISRPVIFFASLNSWMNYIPSMEEKWFFTTIQIVHLLDFVTAPLSAKSYNKKLKQKYGLSFQPIIDQQGNYQMELVVEF
jgi:hypothetical protein